MSIFKFFKQKKQLIGKMGAMPSPIDKNDYPLTKLIASAPMLEDVHLPSFYPPVFNQDRSSQCVACSLALVKYFIEHRQTGDIHQFSTNYIYGNRKPGDAQGEGMFPREAIQTLRSFGVPYRKSTEKFLSYEDAVKFYMSDKTELDKEAYPFRISSFYALNGENDIKQAVDAIGAVTGMFPVFDCLYNTDSTGVVKYNSKKMNHNYGYHEMTIIGWDNKRKAWIVQNSWGTSWGKNGLCYLPYDYPICEAWAVVDDIIEKQLTSAS